MSTTLYLYSGAGNTFVVLDGRSGFPTDSVDIVGLCAKYSTDGLMILREGSFYDHVPSALSGSACDRNSPSEAAEDHNLSSRPAGERNSPSRPASERQYDFAMEFFNPDGSGGMMCGNGGRCIVAFADYLGIRPADGKLYRFVAGDGGHTGEILSVTPDSSVSPDPSVRPDPSSVPGTDVSSDPTDTTDVTEGLPTHHLPAADGVVKTIRIKMIDVEEFHPALDGWFVNTGTRHFVKFVPDIEGFDIEAEGKRYRWAPEFAPVGANANFVKVDTASQDTPNSSHLTVRTFEKGVEGETLACGTGITASAIAAWLSGVVPTSSVETEPACEDERTASAGKVSYEIRAREDDLRVDFRPVFAPNSHHHMVLRFEDVYLTGPAKLYSIIG